MTSDFPNPGPMKHVAVVTTQGTKRHRVLVIDDSVSARVIAKDLLTNAGFEVFALPSAIGATRLILRQRIEAVVVDLSMPGLSGDRLVGLLRQNPRLRGLVLVLVSGEAEDELLRVGASARVDATLSKEAMARELPALLRHCLSRKGVIDWAADGGS